jgi:uncharacterized protein CbrC (UPF0167 family)
MIKESESVEELIERHPELVGWLADKGIVCIKCGEPFWGSIGDLIRSKDGDVEALVAEFNARLKS